MQVVEYLPAGGPLAECTCGRVADEVQIPDLLCDNLKTCAGAECLYLGTEDLAEGHVSEVKGGPVGNSNADRGGCGGDARGRAGKHIRHDVRRAWYEHKDAWVLRYECQLALFAARC